MMILRGAGLLLLLAGIGRPAAAQVMAPPGFPSLRTEPAPSFALGCAPAITPPRECFRYSAARAPDHRWEGLAVGAGAGAVLGVLLGLVGCGQSEDPDASCTTFVIAGGLGGGILGGFIGLLIGAQFPKEEAAPRDSLPQ